MCAFFYSRKIIMKKILLALITSIVSTVAVANEPYKIFVPNPPGSGSGDAVSRKVAEIYNKKTNNSINVVNIAGGNQVPAILAYKKEKAAAILLVSSQLVYKTIPDSELPYSDNDFHLIGDIGENLNFFWARTDSDIKTTKDLFDALPKSKKPLVGSQSALTMVNIKSLAKYKNVDVKPVSFKGVPEMLINVLNKEIDVGLSAIGGNSVMEYVRKGDLRLIGHTGSRPIKVGGKIIPSIRADLGIPQFNGYLWIAVTPGTENTAIVKELKAIIASKEMQDYFESLYLYPVGGDMWQNIKNMRSQAEKNQDIIKP
jgi:tripartite-type tricarboxylate transporter receptor subunit TctC